MTELRHFVRAHRGLALLVVAAALCLKALVPTGYMVGTHSTLLTVEICADASGVKAVKQIAVPQRVAPGEGGAEHAKAEGHCPYSALSFASLTGVDAVLLALALGFILALGFVPERPASVRRTSRLRPPLRGPPLSA